MAIKNEQSVRGIVTEILPQTLYRVSIGGKEYIGYLSGKMKINKIGLSIGDSVNIILDPYKGKTSNRIIRRI